MRPLAERMRPKSLDEYVGQSHIVGQDAILRQWVRTKTLPSLIFWGPPGVGKTSLAKLLAEETQLPFYSLSAVEAGVKDVREAISKAKKSKFFDSGNPILFIDEIHRFSKSQQDALLGAVEQGIISLIGATTENPSFEVIPALLSRCQVYILKPLTKDQLSELYNRAVQTDEVLRDLSFTLEESEALFTIAAGDARKMYNVLEMISIGKQKGAQVVITDALVKSIVQQNIALFDKGGEHHYDVASALIKSIRGSDPNASVYWLARMLEGGEDVKFIARRLMILASEDIGLANPNALLLATSGAQAVQMIGMPEARIILSQVVIYLAASPKSNSAYLAIDKAIEEVRKNGKDGVPLHLRNAPTSLMKEIGYGLDYQYVHNFHENFVLQEYMPESIENMNLYIQGENASEDKLVSRLARLWKGKYNFSDKQK